MKKKYIKLNDNYSHLSLGNIINAIKEESQNKTSAIQSEVFCAIFNIDYINESTVNNYCIGSRSIGNDYKQKYINLKKQYEKNNETFLTIICNILTIINGRLFDIKNIKEINTYEPLKRICEKLYNISKNDFLVNIDTTTKFRNLIKCEKYYELFIEFLCFSIIDAKQPIYEEDKIQSVIETILTNTDISINDLQNFLLLELNEGINFSHSLINLANSNNPYANYHLAVMEYRGEFSGEKRYDKAFEYFEKSAKCNHPSAIWMMGNMILNGHYGKDKNIALKYFEKAKDLGNIAAINSLGLCYKEGIGTKKDINKALKLFKEAANKNYVYALNNLGLYYELENKKEKAFEYFLKSANLNESYACNKVGEYYRLNNNKKEALVYYKKALISNIKETSLWAYYNIAKYYYLSGDISTNTIINIDAAIEYFNKSDKLIESLIELLYIYYNKYIENNKKEDLEKINYYKEQIENHKNYNNNIKKDIENKLKTIKKKNKIKLP